MGETLLLDGEIDAEGRLTVQLPHNAPVGHVRVIIQLEETSLADAATDHPDDAELDREIARLLQNLEHGGMGLTAAEIAQAPEIGAWAHRTDILDSAEFVEQLRRESRQRREQRDDGL